MGLLHTAVVLGTIAGLGLGQNCPILGPAYLEVTDPASSPVLNAARAAFDEELTQAIASGQLGNGSSFSVQVFSTHSSKPLFERYHTAEGLTFPVGPDTLYRVASISKLMTVYTVLAAIGDKHWDDPITDHVPELARARARARDAIDDTIWSEVTLGALASHMSGIGRDFALGDLSPALPNGLPGLPVLSPSEMVQCGAYGLKPCTRKEAMAKILAGRPISATDNTPAYSNMAFQLLAYAVESITRTPFSQLVQKKLLKPLKMDRTFLSSPGNDSNAIIVPIWDMDVGDEAPGAGYYSSAADLTKMGRSILQSTLLPPPLTRRWLKPDTHTSGPALSLGKPWEILRLPIPASPPSSNTTTTTATTRLVDLYAKQGSLGGYQSVLALSPDHGIGLSVAVAAADTTAATLAYNYLEQRLPAVWLAAAEHAAREQAREVFAGRYVSSDDDDDDDEAVFGLQEGEPGLFLSKVLSNGTDILGVVGPSVGVPAGVGLGVWLYPARLASTNKKGGRVAFRAAMGAVGVPAGERCTSWGQLDTLRYGGYPADLFIFEMGRDGKAVAVEIPILKKTLRRAGTVGQRAAVDPEL